MRISKSWFIYLFLFISLISNNSCDLHKKEKIVYTKLVDATWYKDSILTLNIENIERGNYLVLLEMIYDREYPFQDINIGSIIEANNEQYKHIKSICIRNDYGQITKGGIYTYFQKTDTLLNDIFLPDSINELKIDIIQSFDLDLVGIDKIGIRVKSLD